MRSGRGEHDAIRHGGWKPDSNGSPVVKLTDQSGDGFRHCFDSERTGCLESDVRAHQLTRLEVNDRPLDATASHIYSKYLHLFSKKLNSLHLFHF